MSPANPIVTRSACRWAAVALTLSTLIMLPVTGPRAAELNFVDVRGERFTVPVRSFAESRFHRVYKQRLDFSCGSAALATLMTYHYETPVTEAEAIQSMYQKGDKEKIRKEGFSLLDMKKFLATKGFDSDGYRVSLDKLKAVGIPAIVLLNYNGYLHFVVVKGVTASEVLVGDPALGMRVFDREKFENEMWNGIVFIVKNEKKTGQRYFNLAEEWKVRQRAPFSQAMDVQGLSSFTLNLKPSNFLF